MAYQNIRYNPWGVKMASNSQVTEVKAMTKEEYDELNDRLVELNTAVGRHNEDIEWLIDEYNDGYNKIIAKLNKIDDLTQYLLEKENARNSIYKRRRVTVRAGNQVVEVIRND